MPPKPWQARRKPVANISQIIQSNPTIKEQVPKLPPSEALPTANAAANALGAGNAGLGGAGSTASTAGYGSTGYGMGSGLGMSSYGMGSSYGGYGSSYGMGSYGMGGYGSYGMGGMYGMNRYGLMGGQEQKGFLMSTMITLDSFSYLINCLCEIARSLDQNYEGLSLFFQSFKNLVSRLQNGVIGAFKAVVSKIKQFFVGIFNFLVNNVLFMGQKNLKTKYKAVKTIINLAIIILGISLYPLIRKGIRNI